MGRQIDSKKQRQSWQTGGELTAERANPKHRMIYAHSAMGKVPRSITDSVPTNKRRGHLK